MGIAVNTLVAGRYQIVEPLGAGADAEVFRAVDLLADRSVALKSLTPPRNSVARLRFDEEVRILAAFDHPNLIPILGSGSDEGQPFFVMPLIDGYPLEDLLGAGPVPPDDVRHIGAGVADALGYIHSRGVIHRDIKPDNILIDRGLRVFLADFGVAKSWDGPLLTARDHVVGTAGYLAPEQAVGEEASTASDIYALGLVLLEALTGHREYTGTPAERAAAAASRQPHIPPALGAPWCRILGRMTARDPAGRPKIDEVMALLHDAAPISAGAED